MTVTISASVTQPPSPQLQVVIKSLEAGASLDGKAYAATVTDDFTHTFLPQNAGLPEFTSKEEFFGRLDLMKNILTVCDLEVKEVIETPETLVLYIRTHALTKGGASNGDPEVILIFQVAQQADGSYKVRKTREYLDTAKFGVFSEAVRKELGV